MTDVGDQPVRTNRHYGLDWLRIAAFALLILYHIGMVFAPWTWVIKTNHSYPELIAPMSLLTPWRLALLFAVSGYASWHLFQKAGSAGRFLHLRNIRLLVPLAFGMGFLVPVEMWVRVMEKGYPHGYLHFWLSDYWRSGEFWGREFPSWEHLWFVAYLWTYTALLAAALAIGRARIEAGAAWLVEWLSKGWRILWFPIAGLAVAKLGLLFVVPEDHGLLSDWAGHAQYLPMFLFGFVLAGTPQLWAPLQRKWKAALVIAALSGAVVVVVELVFPGETIPPRWVMAGERAAQVAMAWTMTIALFVLADRYWNRDHRWRKSIAEAVFPFYLIHQPAIVVITWYSLPLKLNPWVEFATLLAGTGAACAAFYLIGREIGWLRPLIGLGPRSPRAAPEISPQPA
ncbi:acyltransferase family protein [Sphingomonas sp. BT-65]|uniref:acyltransferase family protein n=1 Tax=Sphingomonas sp. BT-65 TaxID=2989821 RepID=UPI0022366189|nr:acyltransferase family protein [Sphingomonas sp. BT-65]MCW4461865.1 acyltransferase family protein [Sphingomonas sp. BT-65]